MINTIQESLQIINDFGDIKESIKHIKHDTVLVKYLLIAFNVDYKFSPDLGVGYPDKVRLNRNAPDGISDSQLRSEHRGMYLFNESHKLDIKKRVALFGNLLESIHYKESDLLVAIKDGKFSELYPNIKYTDLYNEYPHWFPLNENVPEAIESPLEKLMDDLGDDEALIGLSEEIVTTLREEPQIAPTVAPKSVQQPQRLDKRSLAYRQSIGRK